jgi:hypothetical protein
MADFKITDPQKDYDYAKQQIAFWSRKRDRAYRLLRQHCSWCGNWHWPTCGSDKQLEDYETCIDD